MLQISLTDFKANAGKYVSMVNEQEIYITKNGKLVAKLVRRRATRWRLRNHSLEFCLPIQT